MEKLKIKVEATGTGKGRRFSIATKIAVAKARAAGHTQMSIAKALDISDGTVFCWQRDYLAGKFDLTQVMSVARKPITTSVVTLMQQIKTCEEKLADLKAQARQRIDADYQAALAQLS